MAASRSEPTPMASLQKDLRRMEGATLAPAVEDADRIVALLEAARDQVANGKRRPPAVTLGGGHADAGGLQPRTSTRRA